MVRKVAGIVSFEKDFFLGAESLWAAGFVSFYFRGLMFDQISGLIHLCARIGVRSWALSFAHPDYFRVLSVSISRDLSLAIDQSRVLHIRYVQRCEMFVRRRCWHGLCCLRPCPCTCIFISHPLQLQCFVRRPFETFVKTTFVGPQASLNEVKDRFDRIFKKYDYTAKN